MLNILRDRNILLNILVFSNQTVDNTKLVYLLIGETGLKTEREQLCIYTMVVENLSPWGSSRTTN